MGIKYATDTGISSIFQKRGPIFSVLTTYRYLIYCDYWQHIVLDLEKNTIWKWLIDGYNVNKLKLNRSGQLTTLKSLCVQITIFCIYVFVNIIISFEYSVYISYLSASWQTVLFYPRSTMDFLWSRSPVTSSMHTE